MVEERQVSIRLLCAGILRNISPLPSPSAVSAIDIDRQIALPLITPVISSVSLLDVSRQVCDLISKPQVDPIADRPSLKHAPKADHKSPTEMVLDRVEAKLRNVQLSLEILTGICATLPDPEDQEGEDSADIEEDADVEEDSDENKSQVDIEMDDAASEPEPDTEVKVNGSAIPQRALLPNVLPSLLLLVQPTPLSFSPIQSGSVAAEAVPSHPPTTSALSAIHISALECLNNACIALALEEQERQTGSTTSIRTDAEDGRRVWTVLWTALGSVGLEGGRGQERRKEMWEAAVGVMWGVGGIWRGCIVSV